MTDEEKKEDTIESLQLQIKKLKRTISIQEKRMFRVEALKATREKVAEMLREERLEQENSLRHAQNEIIEKTEQIKIMLENAPVGLTVFDEDFKFIDCNEAVLKLYGVTKEFYREFFGSMAHSPELQPDGKSSYEKAMEIIKRVMAGETIKTDWLHCMPDGELLPVELTIVRVKQGDKYIGLGYIYDMREQIRLREEIEETLIKSQEANRAKSVFLANMSHEIRTPLNAVIGLSDLIMETSDNLDEESHYRLEQINHAGETLLSTVNDILDISKIEAGKFELVPAVYDIPSMINDAVNQSLLNKGEKPIEFKMDVCKNLPTHLCGDELRVKQILNNLLSNAFKYTVKGTVELIVECTRENETVWLTFKIRDTGIGIRQEDLNQLFTDYVQMDMEANRNVVGTGLGLPIAKRLVELMNGQIMVESEYGAGSTFTMTIMQENVTDNVIGPEVIDSLENLHYFRNKTGRKWERISLPYARVLIVDDVLTNLDVAKGLMKPYHMKVDCVTSGLEAIEAMHDSRVRYNAIFMDHMMPGMDGIEATQRIREIETDYARNIPIIALTANAIVGNEEMFLENGFQAFISKPIEINHLDSVIREWVRDKEQEALFTLPDEYEPFGAAEQSRSTEMNLPELLENVSGLNAERGLTRFGGDGEAYLDVLRSFVINTTPLLDTAEKVIEEALRDRNRLNEYETIVHGIKGSSGSICAEDVSDIAKALELAAHSGDLDYAAANNAKLIIKAKELISGISDALDNIDKDTLRYAKEKPDTGLLTNLIKACEEYDMFTVDSIIEELESFKYESDGELIPWLRENAEKTNFEEIVERLKNKLQEEQKWRI